MNTKYEKTTFQDERFNRQKYVCSKKTIYIESATINVFSLVP